MTVPIHSLANVAICRCISRSRVRTPHDQRTEQPKKTPRHVSFLKKPQTWHLRKKNYKQQESLDHDSDDDNLCWLPHTWQAIEEAFPPWAEPVFSMHLSGSSCQLLWIICIFVITSPHLVSTCGWFLASLEMPGSTQCIWKLPGEPTWWYVHCPSSFWELTLIISTMIIILNYSHDCRNPPHPLSLDRVQGAGACQPRDIWCSHNH